jgi:hypothetical protein
VLVLLIIKVLLFIIIIIIKELPIMQCDSISNPN